LLSCYRPHFRSSLSLSAESIKASLLTLLQTTLKAAIDSRDTLVGPLALVNIEVNRAGDSKYVAGKSSYGMAFDYA